ncbi:hypothetical protein [Nocardioides sp. YIM 152315]|uniref:hypothetical protein n=1 Tax=Nocardioides sp. YIM 152315 TaxID=3031760 RepID=UPI0023DCDC4C|nr:hypothetical protein [Nocardioides sp. YIM 152315]MDF1603394.1 hypothetical protein [Nocardioides sp. YIM 152315]
MALDPLASVADLPDAWVDSADADRALAVASSAIRDAAGCAIGETTGTVTVPAPSGRLLALPGPVRDVTAVTIDGTAVTDYRNVGNGLWRRCGWACEPVDVTVTATFGLGAVPDDIAEMCVDLAIAWLQHRETGGGSTAGLKSVRIDDAAESYTDEAAGQVSPLFIPEVTRNWLRARFSGGVAVVETS